MKRIAIHSVPRSGSTWLGSIFDAHPNVCYKFQPLFSYVLKDAINQQSSTVEIIDFFNRMMSLEDDFLDQTQAKDNNKQPLFEKSNIKAIAYKEVRYHHVLSNLLEKDNEVKVVGLIRDPRAVLASWWKAPKEFNKAEWDFEDEWYEAKKKNESRIENFYGYLKWKEVTDLFLTLAEKYPNNFKLVEYDNLLHNTEMQIQELMHFCGLEIDEQQKQFIAASKSRNKMDAYAVYKKKSKDDSWEKELPINIKQFIIEDLKGTNLAQFLK